MTSELLFPIIQQDNVRNVHFFNGRLLTGEDLRDEQIAQRKMRQQLGRAIGSGVVSGLRVEPIKSNGRIIKVTSGLAINLWGQGIHLPENVEVELVASALPGSEGTAVFDRCDDAPVSSLHHGTTSVYILTIAPASEFEGSVPIHQLSDNGKAAGCGRRYAVEGVKFNLAGVYTNQLQYLSSKTRANLSELLIKESDQTADLSQLRNYLAHICLGTEEVAAFSRDPYEFARKESSNQEYGTRRAAQLTRCEVPLALIHLTSRGIRFVDMWAVRRRPAPPPLSQEWPLLVGSRRKAESEAAYLQFQDHLDWLMDRYSSEALNKLVAKTHFRFLPPAALIPEKKGENISISWKDFLSGIDCSEEHYIGSARLTDLINRSYTYAAIDLDEGEGLKIYRVREAEIEKAVIPFVAYVSLHIPALEYAKYDEGRWNFGNYG